MAHEIEPPVTGDRKVILGGHVDRVIELINSALGDNILTSRDSSQAIKIRRVHPLIARSDQMIGRIDDVLSEPRGQRKIPIAVFERDKGQAA